MMGMPDKARRLNWPILIGMLIGGLLRQFQTPLEIAAILSIGGWSWAYGRTAASDLCDPLC